VEAGERAVALRGFVGGVEHGQDGMLGEEGGVVAFDGQLDRAEFAGSQVELRAIDACRARAEEHPAQCRRLRPGRRREAAEREGQRGRGGEEATASGLGWWRHRTQIPWRE
jgi:hypothetical protein